MIKYFLKYLIAGSLVCSTPVMVRLMAQPAMNNQSTAIIYQTALGTDYRLTPTDTLQFVPSAEVTEKNAYIFVEPSKKAQTILGIGGALTDASAETFYKLPKEKQQEILTAYYGDKGIGYTLARTHIHSCDFSSASYTYVNENDNALNSFNIAPDRKFHLPFIKECIAAAGGKLTTFISPWSPPPFMKTNNDMLQGGQLKKGYEAAWASYFAKFIKAYEAEGISIWGTTVQNEPLAKQRWESCIYSAAEEKDFVKNYLGPAFQKAGLGDKKIVIWDHNRNFMYQRASVALNDPEAAKYIWGIGYHWYGGDNFENAKKVKAAFPATNLLFTEGCIGYFDAAKIHEWWLGEKYGLSMIHDFNNGVVSWTDWNILLDEQGGPNHVANYCFAPIHANTKTGELTYTNSYYYIGHFSKFVKPGARLISSSSTSDNLLTTAFQNRDGKIAVVVMNSSDKKQSFYLNMENKSIPCNSLPHSILTVLIKE